MSTNQERADRIEQAFAAYVDELGGDFDCIVRDVLADLRHYCDAHDIDFADEDRIAHDNYIAEKEALVERYLLEKRSLNE